MPVQRLGRSLAIVATLSFLTFLLSYPPPMRASEGSAPLSTNVCGPVEGTWTEAGSPYVVTCDVTVGVGKTLTVLPGVVVKFGSWGEDLWVDGTLVAAGTDSLPIIFTSLKDDAAGGDTNGDGAASSPAPDNWSSIRFNSGSSGNVLDHAVVRYGGGQYNENIWVDTADLTLSNSTIAHSSYYGLAFDNVLPPSLSNNTIISNTHLAVYALLTDNADSITLSNNTASGNGVNGFAVAGSVTSTVTWTWNGSDTLPFVVYDDVRVNAGATLTLAPGTVLKFSSWFQDLWVDGTLIADATAENPIIFTSLADDSVGGDTNGDGSASSPAPDDWSSLRFTSGSTGNVLDYAVVRYGGGQYNENVWVDTTDLTLTDNTIAHSSYHGLTFDNVLPSSLSGNTLSSNTMLAVYAPLADNADSIALSGNTASGNGVNGFAVAGSVTGTVTWAGDDGLPFVVYDDVTVNAGATLALAPGTVLKFYSWWQDLWVNGRLTAQATAENQITFTSLKDDSVGGDTNGDGPASSPAGNDWSSLRFTSSSTGSVLDHTVVRYGGGEQNENVWVNAADLTLSNSEVRHSSGNGIMASGNARVELISDLIVHNIGQGIRAESGAVVTATNNTIDGNGRGVDIDAATATLVNNLVTHSTWTGVRAANGATVDLSYNDVFNPGATNYEGLGDPTGQNGNLSTDPSYVSPASIHYGLLARSAAIDAGTSDGAPATDLAGNPRFDDPGVANLGGGAMPYYDMGALERQDVSDPLNLAVTTASLNVAEPEPGDPVEVHWTVHNDEIVTAEGGWTDAVFASEDAEWDIDDRLVATVEHGGDLLPGQSYDAQASIAMPPGLPGTAYLLVRADYGQVLRESVETDNETAVTATLTMPLLEVGGSVALDLTAARPERYLRVDVAQNPVGQDLLILLDDGDNEGLNELYLSWERLPSRQESDHASAASAADHQLQAEVPQAGTCYVLVHAASLATDPSPVTVSASLLGFAISDVQPASAGNRGGVTLALHGSAFGYTPTVRLLDGTTVVRQADSVSVVDNTVMYATFDLTGLPARPYQLELEQTFVSLDDLENPVEETRVAAAPTPFEVLTGGAADVQVTLDMPWAVRAGRAFEYEVSYVNNGSVDAPAPLFVVAPSAGTQLQSPGEMAFAEVPIHLLGVAHTGPADVLRPGEGGSLRLQGLAPVEGATVYLSISSATDGPGGPDFEGFVQSNGGDPTTAEGLEILAALEAQFGTTWATYSAGLGELAAGLASYDEHIHSVSGLLLSALSQGVAATTQGTPQFSSAAPEAGEADPEPPPPPYIPQDDPKRLASPVPVPPGADGHFDGKAYRPYCDPDYLQKARAWLTWRAETVWASSYPARENYLHFLNNPDETKVYTKDDPVCQFLATGSKAFKELHTRKGGALAQAKKRVKELHVSDEGNAVGEHYLGRVNGVCNLKQEGLRSGAFLSIGGGFRKGGHAFLSVTGCRFHGQYITYKGVIKYSLVDRYDFQAKNFDRNHSSSWSYDLGWCNKHLHGTALGFDAYYEVEVPFEFTMNCVQQKQASCIQAELQCPACDADGPLDVSDLEPPKEPATEGQSPVRRSFDPNDKVGSAGAGTRNRVAEDQALLYTVFFENDPEQATAPAQRVVIEDPLDADLDWSTFELGEFVFGDTRVSAPPGLRACTSHVDTTNLDGSPLRVNLSGAIDLNTGLVTWVLDSVDPDTGAPPNDPDAGFLPVNDETHRGEGHVTFLVWPKSNLPGGTEIHNQAKIFFDLNLAIDTPITLHTIGGADIYLPLVLRNSS